MKATVITADEFGFSEEDASDEIMQMIRQDFQDTHPASLASILFRADVMERINGDHHKHRNGCLTITYDHYESEWRVEHPGYIRDEVVGRGSSYLEAALEFRAAARRANARLLNRQIEDEVNGLLDNHESVEIGDGYVTLYRCEEGQNRWAAMFSLNVAGMTAEEVVSAIRGRESQP